MRDVCAVATGLRPLRDRERRGIQQKSAAATRRDEWEKGRPPTSTVEHNLPAGDQSNATFSTSLVPSAIPEIQSVTPIETAAFKATADLREKIRNEGLTPGTIVECFNNTSLDRW